MPYSHKARPGAFLYNVIELLIKPVGLQNSVRPQLWPDTGLGFNKYTHELLLVLFSHSAHTMPITLSGSKTVEPLVVKYQQVHALTIVTNRQM